jgi:hypothetical protein
MTCIILFCSKWEDVTWDGRGHRRSPNGVLGNLIRLYNPGVVEKDGTPIAVTSWKHFALAQNVNHGTMQGLVRNKFWVTFFLLTVFFLLHMLIF